ncbi:MAG: response regulator [Rickettsiaceae bacterium]|nr:response regulator [Rickettsiaceae bacterium]
MSKVLVVEDNDLNLKLFRDLLRTRDHDVVESSDGINVTNIVKTEKPDLILMDIQLNGISGIDLISDLKKNPETYNIPIIAITAFAMKKDEIKISSSGCDLYISKPVSIDRFFCCYR